MTKKMLISVDADESRVAIIEDGRLVNLEIETVSNEQVKGNLYKGVVHKVEQSLQAAFVDFGVEKQGFLPLSEIHPRLFPKGSDKRPSIQDVLQPRQEVLVQVIRDEIGNKGATLSTYISMPGRYLVLIPESEKTGVSRKISDEERQRLKEVVADMELPEGFGVIIRTAGSDRTSLELQKDLAYLTRVWEVIDGRYREQKGSGLVFEERSLAVRAIRDYFTEDTEEVWLDDQDALREVNEFVSVIMPQQKDAVKHYRGTVPLFIKHGVEDQIEEVFSRRVPLSTGGSIVIDTTEALVAIDVNSGRIKGEDIEETAFMTNMEAAKEIARQVVIRDLGGLIIIDFIDMKDRKRMRQVENALRDAFQNDKARRKFSRISEFGLLEMSRQRLKSTLLKSSFERCKNCDGQGWARSPDSAGMYLLRRIREVAGSGRVHQIIVRAPIPVANFVVNRKRKDLYAVEVERQTLVEVYSDDSLPPSQATIEYVDKKGKGRPKQMVQTIDLVRSEVLRRDDEPLRKSALLFREVPKKLDFGEVYREIEEEHGGEEEAMAPVAPAVHAAARAVRAPHAPTASHSAQLRAAAPVYSTSELSQPEAPRKVSWWQRLFGVRTEPEVVRSAPVTPAAAPAAPPAARASAAPAAPVAPKAPVARSQQPRTQVRPAAPHPRPSARVPAPEPRVEPPRKAAEADAASAESGEGVARRRRRRTRRRRTSTGEGASAVDSMGSREGASTLRPSAAVVAPASDRGEGGGSGEDQGGDADSQARSRRSRSRGRSRSGLRRPDQSGGGSDEGESGGARASREGGEGGGRPPRERGEGGDRTPREGGESGGRAPREHGEGGGRPPRESGEGGFRSGSESGEGGGRPPRESGEGGGRPPRESGEGGGRPPRESGEGGGRAASEASPPPIPREARPPRHEGGGGQPESSGGGDGHAHKSGAKAAAGED